MGRSSSTKGYNESRRVVNTNTGPTTRNPSRNHPEKPYKYHKKRENSDDSTQGVPTSPTRRASPLSPEIQDTHGVSDTNQEPPSNSIPPIGMSKLQEDPGQKMATRHPSRIQDLIMFKTCAAKSYFIFLIFSAVLLLLYRTMLEGWPFC